MRLLILTPQFPYPPQQGTTLRNFNILRQLAPNHEITLLTFGSVDELRNADSLRAMCKRIEIVPYPARSLVQRAVTTLLSPLPDMALRLSSKSMQDKLDALLREEKFDVVQIEGIEMAGVWRESVIASEAKQHLHRTQVQVSRSSNAEIASSQSEAPLAGRPLLAMTRVVFDDHNAEYVLQRTAHESDARIPARWHAALYSFIQWKKLARYERDICRQADHVVTCSESDARAIHELFDKSAIGNRQSAIAVIPNGVDVAHYVPSDAVCAKPLSEFAMVFTGKMDFRPNVDAMIWFCEEILPRIRAEIPLAHLLIVGQKPSPRVAALQKQDQVQVTGWVPDTRPFIADAAVYVVPLRMGSGTRLKVLEAMAMGKAIVSTTRGVEGIDLQPGRDALIADSPDDFARAVTTLMRDRERRRVLGRAARALAEEKYDWRKIVPKFEKLYLR